MPHVKELEESWQRGVENCRNQNNIGPILRRLDEEHVYQNVCSLLYMKRPQFDYCYPGAIWLALAEEEDDFFSFISNLHRYICLLYMQLTPLTELREATKKELTEIAESRIAKVTKPSVMGERGSKSPKLIRYGYNNKGRKAS